MRCDVMVARVMVPHHLVMTMMRRGLSHCDRDGRGEDGEGGETEEQLAHG